MISIIVCSIDEILRNQLKQNIEDKIGCDFEFLYVDNTFENKGICTIYNELAKKAKGEYLCFVHEDITIQTQNWGEILISKASQKNTGVIGFAGSGSITGFPYWNDGYSFYSYYIQRNKDGSLYSDETLDSKITGYKEVIILDGMFLFCRKEIWTKHHFDENTFKGFHMYDVDFTFSVSLEYKNYVSFDMVITHFSLGNVSKEYYDGMLTFYNKWKAKLPYTIYPELFINKKERERFYKQHLRGFIIEIVKKTKLSNSYIYYYLKRINQINTLSDYMQMIKYISRYRYFKFLNKNF